MLTRSKRFSMLPYPLASSVVVGLLGCQDPASPQIPDVPPGFGTGVSDQDDDATADETGQEPTLGPGECTIIDKGLVGERYQCKGEFAAHFGADDVDEEPFAVRFGWPSSADDYDRPFVSACCGPIAESPACEEGVTYEHVWACTIDAVQQTCIGIGTKVEEIRRNVTIAQSFIKPSLASLRDWLNKEDTITECMTTFLVDTGLSTFSCDEPPSQTIADTTWVFSKTEHGLNRVARRWRWSPPRARPSGDSRC